MRRGLGGLAGTTLAHRDGSRQGGTRGGQFGSGREEDILLLRGLDLGARGCQRVDPSRDWACRRIGLWCGRLVFPGNGRQILGLLVHLIAQVDLDLLTLTARRIELIDESLAGAQVLLVRIRRGRGTREGGEDGGGGRGRDLLGQPLRLLIDGLEGARIRQVPMRCVLGRALHEGHDDLPGLAGLARGRPLQGGRVNAAGREAIQDQVAHRGASLADTHRACARQRIVLLGLHGRLETLDRAHVHPVFGRNLLRGRARAQQSLNVARSQRRPRRGDLNARPITARRATELVRDQHRVAFALGVSEHQGLAIGAGPEQFELNHRFLLIRRGGIVSNYAVNVA